MPEISKTHMGGTMRLGLRPTVFQPGTEDWSKVRKLYGGAEKIWERHRHRYEVNPEYIEKLTASGLSFVGRDEKGERMQILELQGAYHHCLWVPMSIIDIAQIIRSSSVCKLTLSSARAHSTPPRPSSASSLRHLLQKYSKNRWRIS